jgi:hypothetical protein
MRLTMKNTAILLCGVPLLLIAGCSTSFSRMGKAIKDAPEWYGERRAEIRGEGYPKVIEIPEIDPNWKPSEGLAASAAQVAVIQAAFAADERSQVAPEGAAGIAAIAEELRAGFGAELPPGDFLTASDIAGIRESFNVPRVTEGIISQ